ncbi:FMN-binding negative transcriptional regulator [Pseudoroseomonas cervicalis]|uniref:FMN-binding negative transcriptional regulator n=1 Tax=Teichococcus cervicalis TaxID=204525 RepID=UPI0022F1558E|nr:FMN-binding negative transcriptional regulator [Pseudoroseomonas cervicalis]WBV44383.1 FMN-binding negative transcriptional regulator [Pseudoroseomonas cervicalis]
MYTPPAFREDDPAALRAMMQAAGLATLVTATAEGLQATPLPLLLAPEEGEHGTLYGHLARANPQWRLPALGEAMVLFPGPDAYVSPSFYPSKAEHQKVVPTWNYVALHAYGPAEFFEEPARLLDLVTRLTERHEAARPRPWAVADAPDAFIRAQLRGIVGLRLPIARLEGKRKLSQNRGAEDRAGVAAGLAAAPGEAERAIAALIPR